MSIFDIDWNEAVMEVTRERDKMISKDTLRGEAFWDMRAPSFTEHAPKTGYAEAFIDIIKPQKSETVFDMGCGGGTLAIPLSELAQEITAVDFSANMLGNVRDRAAELNIKNINTIKCSWTDDWDAANIGIHDIAISSRSMSVSNLKEAITKLASRARKRVYISTVVKDGPHDRRIYEAIGRQVRPAIDYVYVYNIMYQMGINANINFISENRVKAYKDYDEALVSSRWMVQDMNPEEEKLMDAYMRAHLVEKEDGWELDNSRRFKWAVLWWEKENEDV